MAGEDLRSDVVGSTDCRVGHQATRPPPVVDLRTVANCKVDLIDRDGVTVTSRPRRSALEKLLIVGIVMQPVETGGEAKVGELDVTATVKENVVGLDITKGIIELATTK